jgi:hypothetical protein
VTATSITIPADIFQHTMDVTAGYDLAPGQRLDFVATLSPNVAISPYEGRIVHLNSVGAWEMGCVAKAMPCVMMRGSVPYGQMPTISPYWQSIGTYPLVALPATGGYEISSTEFDTNQSYNINDLLTAGSSNTLAAVGGVITNVQPGTATPLTVPWAGGGTTRTICGQVCRLPSTLKNGNNVIGFWTLFIPGTTDS